MISGNWPAGRKELSLTVNGAPVTDEVRSLTYTDDLNGDSAAVMLGSTAAAQVVLVIDGPGVSYAGAELAVSLGGVPLGVFAVTKTERRGSILTVTAMDAMAGEKMLLTYTPGTASTALGVIREIAAAAGLTMADTSGITDVAVTPNKGLTRRDMLGRMAAILGKNAHIDRYGKLALKWYGITDFAVTADDYYADSLSMAEEDFALDRLECSVTTTTTQTETDESGNTTTSEVVETAVLTAGNGMTGISIANEYMTQAALDAVYAAIGGAVWRPMQLTVYGDVRVESGDVITVTDDAGEAHSVPVMRVEHVWDGGVKTTVTAVGNPSEALGSGGGTLSKAVDNLALEFARFKNLEAENLRAQNAKLEKLEAGRITVRDADGNTVFDADVKGKTVQIGGFTVDADKLAGEKISFSGSEITLTGPDSEVFEQSAHITDANIVWYANDGNGFGARGHIGMAAGFPTLNPDPDGYLHINAIYRGNGIRFGYDGGTPEKWFDMDAYGLKAYMPIRVYNDDQSRYVPVNYDYARAWYNLVKQAEGDPGPDTAPVAGSERAVTSGAMYPKDVTSAAAQLTVDGVSIYTLHIYTIGKMAWVHGQVILTAEGVYTSFTPIVTGLPKPPVYIYDQSPMRTAEYNRPMEYSVTMDGTLRIRYGVGGTGWSYLINLCYPIA